MVIFQDIQILQLELQDLFGFNLMQKFCISLIFQEILLNFGDDGIFHYQPGLEIILYIPLGGSRGGTWMKVRNTFIIFIVSGFWHGANWTFIVWGALNAIYFLPLMLTK